MRTTLRGLVAIPVACLGLMFFSGAAFPEGGDFVGQNPPEIKIAEFLNAPADMPKTLEGLRGRVVLVEFWATWCPPCRAIIPHMKELADKFSTRGLQVISITKEKTDVVKPFAEQHNMTYTIGIDDGGQTVRAYGIRSIPSAFLVGRDGKVFWQGHPAELKENQIEDALRAVEKK